MSKRRRLVFILPIFIVLLEYYSFTCVDVALTGIRPVIRWTALSLYFALCVAFWYILFSIPRLRKKRWSGKKQNYILALFTGFLVAKIVLATPLLIDDLRRLITYSAIQFGAVNDQHLSIPHSVWLARICIFAGFVILLSFLWGIKNQYHYQLKRVKLKFENLPDAFKGLKIVQISDIHSGSFENNEAGRAAVSKGIDLILKENPDIIFFTGDLVNNIAREILYFKDIFRKLQAPLGVYSILGNHDYGDYVSWPSEELKEKNLRDLKLHHAGMGWRLLLNENRVLVNGGDAIAIIGVENWSANGRFKQYGNLAKAYEGLSPDEPTFKILLSHDPSHWDAEIRKEYPDINLTLSGHTHGMQFGIRLPGGFQWSPIQYFYKQWAGLYKEKNQYLYVNVGFGFLGYPGRLGVLPEITVFELS